MLKVVNNGKNRPKIICIILFIRLKTGKLSGFMIIYFIKKKI